MAENTLKKFYRQAKVFVNLPSSKGEYNLPNVIVYQNDKKELGVKSLTAHDEIMLKNPDALLNGEAVCNALTSCVDGIKHPKKMRITDINFLMAVIKKVSSNTHDVDIACPKCEFVNKYAMNLDTIIDSVDYLDETYPVNLSTGLTVFVGPYTYEASLSANAIAFQEARFLKEARIPTQTEEQEMAQMAKLSKIIKDISELNVNIAASSVLSIVKEDEDIMVTDHTEILKFMKNIDGDDGNAITAEIGRISKIGLPQEVEIKCDAEECGHQWVTPLSFDPTSFFTGT